MPSKKDDIDVHNTAALKKRIGELTARLNKQRRKVSRLRAVYLAALRRQQKLAAWRATRRRQLKRLTVSERKAVVQHALARVGETEQPAGSNKGPGIVSLCQIDIIGFDGVAWCACFGGYMLRHYGKVQVTARIAYCPYNVTDAKKGVNGWAGVREDKTKGQPGDCAMMDWERDGTADHFVILVKYLGDGWYETVEGNTSFDNAGSQSNGGAVAHRQRHVNDMAAVCVPAYPQEAS